MKNENNLLAENMRRFGTKNLDIYDQFLIENTSVKDKILLSFAVAGGILIGVYSSNRHRGLQNKWQAVYNKVKQLDPETAKEIDVMQQQFNYPTGKGGYTSTYDSAIDKKLENAIDSFVVNYDKIKKNAPDVLDLDDDGNTDELLKNTFK